jgi:peptide/nickel transport system substrate-binding protein
MKISSRILAFLMVFVMLLALCACGGSTSGSNTSGNSASNSDKKFFRIGFSYAPDSFNPYKANVSVSEFSLKLIYDTLFVTDLTTGEIANSLCTDHTVTQNDDGTYTWALTIRDGVKWTDGQPLTAEDVAFSLMSAVDFSSLYSVDASVVDKTKITVVDDTHLTFVVDNNYAYIEECLSNVPIVPKHIWNQYFEYGDDGVYTTDDATAESVLDVAPSADNMVSSGLFKWDYADDTCCNLALNTDYWNGTSAADEITLIYNVSDMLTALQSGEIDAAYSVPSSAIASMDGDSNISYVAGLNGNYTCLSFNCHENASSNGNPLLLIPEVRQAIDHCLNKEYIIQMAYGNLGIDDEGIIGANSPYYYDIKTYDGYDGNDVNGAIALLEKAGFTYDANGGAYTSGTRYNADGKPLSFSLYYSSGNTEDSDAATIISAECAEAGIQINAQGIDEYTLWDYTDAYDYDMYMIEWSSYHDPFFVLDYFVWDDGANAYSITDADGNVTYPGWNDTGWNSSDYDTLYHQQVVMNDKDERYPIVQKMIQTVYDAAPISVLGYLTYIQAYNSSRWTGFTQYAGSSQGTIFSSATISQQMRQISYIG